MIKKPVLEEVKVNGKFPLVLHIDRSALPPSFNASDIAEIVSSHQPFAFSGQRTPIYPLKDGLSLRAKGFAYRKRKYDEIVRYELDRHILLDIETAKKHGLVMGNYTLPISTRFLEGAGHYKEIVPQPDGSFKERWSAPRPVAAMTLDRAEHEYQSTRWARENGLPVDIPLGWAEFPEFDFRSGGKTISCGGFLALIPTKMDLRLPEILYHMPYLDSIREEYKLEGVDREGLFLLASSLMGIHTRKVHNIRRTLKNPHSMNIKLGTLDDHFQTLFRYKTSNIPLVSFCDLDSLKHKENINDRVFLSNILGDFESFYDTTCPALIASPDKARRIIIPKEDDQKWVDEMQIRLAEEMPFVRGTNLPFAYFLGGYFERDPKEFVSPCVYGLDLLESIATSGQKIQNYRGERGLEELIDMLVSAHGLKIR